MKQKLVAILQNPIFSGSSIMILGSNGVNAVNFLYNFALGKLLGPEGFGELSSLFSLSVLLGMVPFSLGLVIVKYVSAAKTDEEAKNLISWFNRWIFVGSVGLCLMVLVSVPLTSSFLNIQNAWLISLIGISYLFTLPAFFFRSALQGLMRFKETVIGILAENGVKLALGVTLVYAQFAVGGAVFAFVIAAALGCFISRWFIKDFLVVENQYTLKSSKVKSMFLYSIPVLIQSVAITSLYSSDLVLVKHFFSAHDSGLYAALSTLGKVIFFGAGPVGAVMFPMVSKKSASGQGYKSVFFYSLGLTAAIGAAVLLFYWLKPEIAIFILFGDRFLGAAGLLIWFGILMLLFTLSNLLMGFFLSLKETKIVVLPAIAAVSQVVGIWMFHDDLYQVIMVSITVNALLLTALIAYSLFKLKLWNFGS